MEDFYRAFALAITHYVYRNTKIEDYHSKSIKMNLDFYRQIYKMVHQKMGNVERYSKYILKFARSERNGEALTGDEYYSISEEDRIGFVRFYKKIQGEFIYGRSWDLAELVDVNISGTLARFILDGEFKRHCINNSIFDNKTMKDINKDINNRVYSLITLGYLG